MNKVHDSKLQIVKVRYEPLLECAWPFCDEGAEMKRNEVTETVSQWFVFLDSFLKEKSGPTIAFLNKNAY